VEKEKFAGAGGGVIGKPPRRQFEYTDFWCGFRLAPTKWSFTIFYIASRVKYGPSRFRLSFYIGICFWIFVSSLFSVRISCHSSSVFPSVHLSVKLSILSMLFHCRILSPVSLFVVFPFVHHIGLPSVVQCQPVLWPRQYTPRPRQQGSILTEVAFWAVSLKRKEYKHFLT